MSYFFSTLILSCLSPLILGYISVATTLGPWIAPTFAIALVALFRSSKKELLFPLAASSPGGIIATAFGFSFPTLFFLEPDTFIAWLHSPSSFILSIAALSCTASAIGLTIAYRARPSMIEEENLAFPVGQVIHKIVDKPEEKGQQQQLIMGFFASLLFGITQLRTWFGNPIIPGEISVLNKCAIGPFLFPSIRFSLNMMPMLIAIGFIAGSMVTVPLLVGTLSQVFLLHPINIHLFPLLSSSDFTFALCSGIVLVGAFEALISIPQQLFTFGEKSKEGYTDILSCCLIPALFLSGIFFSVFNFSFLSQIYVVTLSVLCAYQIIQIAGKIGLAFLGRFATFVMIPGMLLFKFTALQLTLLSTFVEVVGGVATDALFSYKAAHLAKIDYKKILRYQQIGIIISSLALGIVFWVLCSHFQLGTEQFFAQRAQSRALLIQAVSFDYYVVALGVLFGFLLKRIKINPVLVLGGLLMPFSLSLPLITGGIVSSFFDDKKVYEPLCSGIFAANALTMFVGAFF